MSDVVYRVQSKSESDLGRPWFVEVLMNNTVQMQYSIISGTEATALEQARKNWESWEIAVADLEAYKKKQGSRWDELKADLVDSYNSRT